VIDKKPGLTRMFRCPNRAEPAMRQAFAAADAIGLTDDGLVAAAEFVPLLDPGRKDQVQIRSVHVAVGDDRTGGKHGERCGNAGLPSPAFAADDHKLLYHRSLTTS
jgi:hypothetical protein